MRVTLFDYGAGNLYSLGKALVVAGGSVRVERDARRCLDGDVLVLPGVGAFGHACEQLLPGRVAMADAVRAGFPLLGICLGMQLLFDTSEEGPGRGLGVVAGRVRRLAATRVPQIGWNTIDEQQDALLVDAPLTVAYYANSYVADPAESESVTAWSTHEGDRFPAIVRAGRAIGIQFHPEKSSAPGIAFLAAALRECAV